MEKVNFQEDDTHVLRGSPSEAILPKETLGKKILDSLIQAAQGGIAMVDAFTQEKLLYVDFLQKIVDLAESFRILGYKGQNTVVSICSENCLDYFVPQFAALLNLSIAAPVNHNYTLYELEHVLKITSPKVVFCSKEALDKITQLKKTLSFIEQVIVLGNSSQGDELPGGVYFLNQFIQMTLKSQHVNPKGFQPYEDIAEKTVALVMSSSGTTGLPKGVALSHLCLTAMLTQYALTNPSPSDDQQFQMGLLPFFHAFGNSMTTWGLLLNARTVICFKRFDEDVYLKTIQDYKIKMLGIAPPIALLLAKSPKVDRYDLSSVETIICGAAPLSKMVEEEVKKRLVNCKEVSQAYGLTEMTITVTSVPLGVQRPGSCGKLVPFLSLKLINPDTGRSLGPHQVGELCLKGPSTMLGYYNDAQATKDSFTPKGWLRTGDLGYYDEEEYIYLVDRLKELIKYKGFQVAPAELEGVLINHPEIADAGVVGFPDQRVGERPLAFVVKNPGSQITEDEIKQYVAGVLSDEKRLSGGVIFVSSIPKNPSGKILRKELRKLLKQRVKSKL